VKSNANNILSNPYFQFFIVSVLVWFFYSGLLIPGYNVLRTEPHSYNYFKQLAQSFMQGRLDVDCPPGSNCHDLIEFNQKYYLYWPPIPALIYIPLVVAFGLATPDPLIASIFGALNCFMFMLAMNRIKLFFKLQFPIVFLSLLGVTWGLGTVHFYMSMTGSVWFVSQIMALTFLLFSLYLFLGKHHNRHLILSGLFFALAVYTRNNLIFTGLIYLLIHWLNHYKNGWKTFVFKGILFVIPIVLFSAANFAYNFKRFGHLGENGLKYHNMSPYFTENFNKYGYFSTHYLSNNARVELIKRPDISKDFPYIVRDDDGFGIFWNSPIFLLGIHAFLLMLFHKITRKYLLNAKEFKSFFSFEVAAFISFTAIAILIFCIMGTGWVQYAGRYTLDFQLVFFIFLLYGLHCFHKKWLYRVLFLVLILASVIMNFAGAYQFNNLIQ
jgi:hypothetical protein